MCIFLFVKLSLGAVQAHGLQEPILSSRNFHGCLENLIYNDLNLIDLAKNNNHQVSVLVSASILPSMEHCPWQCAGKSSQIFITWKKNLSKILVTTPLFWDLLMHQFFYWFSNSHARPGTTLVLLNQQCKEIFITDKIDTKPTKLLGRLQIVLSSGLFLWIFYILVYVIWLWAFEKILNFEKFGLVEGPSIVTLNRSKYNSSCFLSLWVIIYLLLSSHLLNCCRASSFIYSCFLPPIFFIP